MLETINLAQKLRKSAYKRKRPRLQQRLYALQLACRDAGIPVIIVFEGWAAAGKDAALKLLTHHLDPRGVTIYDIQSPRTYEMHMPWLWRFWRKIPSYGEIAIFYHSWYSRVLEERVEATLPKQDWPKAYRDIVNFERTLANDGYAIVKLFFHISKEAQAQRFRQLEQDPLSKWRVRPYHWERHAKYDQYAIAIEEMLKRTNSNHAPWTIIAASDRRWARIATFETTIRQIEATLQARGLPLPVEILAETASPQEKQAA